MTTRRILIGSIGGLIAQCASAQRPAEGPKTVFRQDIPDLMMKGWSAIAVEVSYGPGESTPSHRHPGITIAYVLEGEVASKVGDEPEKTYKQGQMFMEFPGQLHAVSRNASTTRPAKLLAILLAERGQQLTTFER